MSCYIHQHESIDCTRHKWKGRRAQIRLSARQVAKNVSYTGGFIGMLASLAARAIPLADRVLPTILSELTTGLLSVGVNKVISGSGAVGDGLYLAPHPRFVEGDGLFLKHGDDISDGAGLRMGKNSSFKNIPVLGWLLLLFRRNLVLCISSLSLTFIVEQYG